MPINIDNIISSNNSNEIKEFILENKEELTSEQTISLLKSISPSVIEDINVLLQSQQNKNIEKKENLEEFIKLYIEYSQQLGFSRHIVQVIKAVNDIDYLKQCVDNKENLKLNAWDTVQLIEATKDTTYIKKCVGRVEELNINEHEITLVAATSDKKYIEEYLEEAKKNGIDKNSTMYLLTKLAEIGDLDFVKEAIDKYELIETEKIQLIKAGGKDFAKEYVLSDLFGRDSKLNLMDFIGEPEFLMDAMEKNVLNLPPDNSSFSLEILEKYGLVAFKNIEDDVFSKKAIEVLGKEKVELLIKYYKVAGKNVDLKGILEHEEEFNKYLQLRKDIFSSKQLEALELHSAINEFNRNYELISDCMTAELTDDEKKLLSGVLKETVLITKATGKKKEIAQMSDKEAISYLFGECVNLYINFPKTREKNGLSLPVIRQKISQMSEKDAEQFLLREVFQEEITISSKEDLKDLPQVRAQKIAEMQDKDKITYMLTGMKFDEYQQKIAQFFDNDRINEALTELDEGNNASVLKNIKAANEMINLILGMDSDKRQEALNNINNELANEFTEHGSEIANMRKQFANIDTQIKKIYGQELSSTLSKVQMPGAVFDEEKGVDIIKLEGQDFKLLIHGIDAYSKGSGKFEERSVGKSYLCTSLISEKTLLKAKAGCYYGFSNIGSNALIMSGATDIRSYTDTVNSLDVKAEGEAEFNTTNQIIDKSIENGTYSEVDLWREYIGDNGEIKKVTPDYIICFSSIGINENDIKEAKRLGIPIVLIDEEKYIQKSKVEDKVEDTISKKKEVEEKITPKNIKKWWSKIGDIVPALKGNEAFQAIVDEMNKDINKEGPAIGE